MFLQRSREGVPELVNLAAHRFWMSLRGDTERMITMLKELRNTVRSSTNHSNPLTRRINRLMMY